MVQLKRKVKLKQKTESPRQKAFMSKKAIACIIVIGILAAVGGAYAIYKNWGGNEITVADNTDRPIESPTEVSSNQDSVKEVDSAGITPQVQDVLQQTTQNDEQGFPDGKQEVNPQTTNNQLVANSDLEQEALSVIRGNYGNNPIRRQRLGDRYQEIQDRVNQMYWEGKVR